ncbi:MAG: hypothetical protein ACOYNF_19735, partial [Rhodoferax sp.]
MAKALKKASACRSFLIIRDIFPEWAVDMGLMGLGLPYRVFKAIGGVSPNPRKLDGHCRVIV